MESSNEGIPLISRDTSKSFKNSLDLRQEVIDHKVYINVENGASERVNTSKSKLFVFLGGTFAILAIFSFLFFFNNSNFNEIIEGKSRPVFSKVTFNSNTEEYEVVDTYSNKVYATGTFEKNVNSNGWNYLTVTASDFPKNGHVTNSEDLVDWFIDGRTSIGLLEGYLTCKEINQWYVNFYSGLFDGGDPTEDSIHFLEDNHKWMTTMADKHYLKSEHWLAVKGLLAQILGMVQGVELACPGTAKPSDTYKSKAYLPSMKRQPLLMHFLLMNANGDLYQIAEKFDQENAPPSDDDDAVDKDTGRKPQYSMKSRRKLRDNKHQFVHSEAYSSNSSEPKVMNTVSTTDHCSAIIKLLPDRSDILFSHSTWDDYQCSGPRIFKHVSYPLLTIKRDGNEFTYHPTVDTDGFIVRHEVHFSSSPGLLSSVDDFYVIHSVGNLAVMETSLDIYNKDLLALIHPE